MYFLHCTVRATRVICYSLVFAGRRWLCEVCEGYVFTRVCHSVHRGDLPHCMLRYTPPPEQAPPEQTPLPSGSEAGTPLGDTGNKRAVRILLERNLVVIAIIVVAGSKSTDATCLCDLSYYNQHC